MSQFQPNSETMADLLTYFESLQIIQKNQAFSLLVSKHNERLYLEFLLFGVIDKIAGTIIQSQLSSRNSVKVTQYFL
jgi:hypothetical protein